MPRATKADMQRTLERIRSHIVRADEIIARDKDRFGAVANGYACDFGALKAIVGFIHDDLDDAGFTARSGQ